MSIKLMSSIWELEGLNSREKMLLLALADHANDEGTCYPSVARLQIKCCCSSSTLSKTMKVLRGAGIITVKPRSNTLTGRKTNLYQINHSCFHTGEMMDTLRVSRQQVKDKSLKISHGRNDGRTIGFKGTRFHTGEKESTTRSTNDSPTYKLDDKKDIYGRRH